MGSWAEGTVAKFQGMVARTPRDFSACTPDPCDAPRSVQFAGLSAQRLWLRQVADAPQPLCFIAATRSGTCANGQNLLCLFASLTGEAASNSRLDHKGLLLSLVRKANANLGTWRLAGEARMDRGLRKFEGWTRKDDGRHCRGRGPSPSRISSHNARCRSERPSYRMVATGRS